MKKLQRAWKVDLMKMVCVLTGDHLKAIPEVSDLHVRNNSTISTVNQVYILVSKLLTESPRPPQIAFQAFMYP